MLALQQWVWATSAVEFGDPALSQLGDLSMSCFTLLALVVDIDT